jgi:hypothetical protein
MPRATDTEVALLETTFQPTPGAVIAWEAIEETLGLARTEPRFRTLCRAWQRFHLRESNRVFKAQRGVGMCMLLEYQRLGGVRQEVYRVGTAVERVKQHADDVQFVDLTDPQKVEGEHLQQFTRRLQSAFLAEQRKLQAIPRVPPPATPRPPQRQMAMS